MSGVISSRVSNLKFMQRAIQKNEHKAQAEAIDKRVPEAHNEVGIYILISINWKKNRILTCSSIIS